jgi:hypothetical protein
MKLRRRTFRSRSLGDRISLLEVLASLSAFERGMLIVGVALMAGVGCLTLVVSHWVSSDHAVLAALDAMMWLDLALAAVATIATWRLFMTPTLQAIPAIARPRSDRSR